MTHNNNGFREDKPCCYFHPREVVIGVCPLCLNERLIFLASTQALRSSNNKPLRSAHKPTCNADLKKTPIKFHKIFHFSSLLHRLEFRPWKSDAHDLHDHEASTSQEDSFISIKFGENGTASWEKKNNTTTNEMTKSSKAPQEKLPRRTGKAQSQPKETKTVVEHGKPRVSSLRWRKRIGHLFHVVRWKRSTKETVCHVSNKVKGVKVMRKGWIRNFTRKR